jgi:hypothetical protein
MIGQSETIGSSSWIIFVWQAIGFAVPFTNLKNCAKMKLGQNHFADLAESAFIEFSSSNFNLQVAY